jgi:RecA/RadA recombinase
VSTKRDTFVSRRKIEIRRVSSSDLLVIVVVNVVVVDSVLRHGRRRFKEWKAID